jgi:UDP-N-acetylmuramate dehydrogenase
MVKLNSVEPAESAKRADDTVAEREKRHIQNVRAAGSFFMNPVAPRKIQEMFEKEKGMKSREGRVPAGWLIEKAGMKGATVGGAIASPQHPNYLMNKDNATAADVRELAEQVRNRVSGQFAIELREEAVVL